MKERKWKDEIIAWANGAQIEFYHKGKDSWIVLNHPDWDKNTEYRIYDPLREIKEAFERGDVIQFRELNKGVDWTDNWMGESFLYSEGANKCEWRVKPEKEEKEEGEDGELMDGDWAIILESGEVGRCDIIHDSEHGRSKYVYVANKRFCKEDEGKLYRKATSGEILNAQKILMTSYTPYKWNDIGELADVWVKKKAGSLGDVKYQIQMFVKKPFGDFVVRLGDMVSVTNEELFNEYIHEDGATILGKRIFSHTK